MPSSTEDTDDEDERMVARRKPIPSDSSDLCYGYDSKNWYIHQLYLHHEYKECLVQIEKMLQKSHGLAEYPLYLKGLIMRQLGKIEESFQLFQAAACLNPQNLANLKQVGCSLYLLGKHTSAIEVYEEIFRLSRSMYTKMVNDDWKIHHHIGLSYMYLKDYDKAVESLRKANSCQRHDATFLQLGRVYMLQENYKAAIDTYLEALEFSPENSEMLTTLGLLYLRLGENYRAFDYLGNSLTHDQKNPKTILAAGSIIQDHNDMDVALVKYRIAAVLTPNSSQLWNNIGMCFFGKQKHMAAISCLKKALAFDPFEWITCYNLGLVHLNTGQYASAFHYFSAAINLKSDFPSSYMYLAITLSRLEDFENSASAYEKAIEMDKSDHLFYLNYAITLYGNDEIERSKECYSKFIDIFDDLDEETKGADLEVIEQKERLEKVLQIDK